MGSNLTEEEATLVAHSIAKSIRDIYSWWTSINWCAILRPYGENPQKDDPFFYDELFET